MSATTHSASFTGMSAWALSFGGIIGWGSFFLPGTHFLPDAGPVGALIGILAASALALLICANYASMIRQYPEVGGSYTYTRHILGEDHAFLVVWCLILAYLSLLWANTNAFSLLLRYVTNNALQGSVSYSIAGHTISLGEALSSLGCLVVLGLLTAYQSKIADFLRKCLSITLFVSIGLIFLCVSSQNGLAPSLSPAFALDQVPALQILNVCVLAPWMFVGFETITHAVGTQGFSVKNIFSIGAMAIFCGMLVYLMLTLTAASVASSGYEYWSAYVQDLPNQSAMKAIPVFFNTIQTLGSTGKILLLLATLSAIFSSILVFYRSAARLIRIMASSGLLPTVYAKTNASGVPVQACLLILALSLPMPFLGPSVISWNADVSTLTVSAVYAYISICALKTAQGKTRQKLCGILGTIVSFIILGLLLIPNVFADNTLSTESYLILTIWSLLGIVYYWYIFSKDTEHRFGKSTVMWLMMLLLLFFCSSVWLRLFTETNLSQEYSIHDNIIKEALRTSSFIQFVVISIALFIIFILFKIVIDRQKEADKLANMAKEHNKAKSIFLSNISHDIRTPMNAIIGMTDILLHDDLPKHSREYVLDIKNAGERLLSTLNDVLDFSKIESGNVSLEIDEYEFTEIINELSFTFLNQIGGKPIELTYNIDPNIPQKMRGDVKRISQIMNNIVENAANYTDHGVINLEIKSRKSDENHVILGVSIADSGRGIRKEDYQKIFESFSQIDTNKDLSREGTGLGLAIARQLLALMGGTINVESEYGKGSRFSFEIQQEIVDQTPIVQEKSEITALRGAFFFDSTYTSKSFLQLAQDLHLAVQQIDDTQRIHHDNYDYFITDNYEFAELIGQKYQTCQVALVQNYLISNFVSKNFVNIEKPLYCKNFYNFLQTDTKVEENAFSQSFFTVLNGRVLVADDMPINIKITTELMKPFGLEIDDALNGQEALEKIYANKYDVVFMDHMMPVMDGIEAVTILRQRSEEAYRHLPVVVLTANATSEAKEEFFQNGFSDFISKPVHIEEIAACLQKWLPKEKIQRSDEPIISSFQNTEEFSSQEFNIPGINKQKGITNSGSEKIFYELLGDVYNIIDEKNICIEKYITEKDIHSITIQVHALKTTCRMIGAMALSDKFYALEKLGSTNNLEQLLEDTPGVLADLIALKPYLQPYASKQVTAINSFEQNSILSLLDTLKQAMQDFDLNQCETCIEKITSYQFDETLSPLITRLRDLVSALDYDEAAKLVTAIREQISAS